MIEFLDFISRIIICVIIIQRSDSMDIFNTKILNNRQRWNRAFIYAIGATLISIFACAIIQMFLIRSSFVYLAAAYFISWIILESGHGVQKKFSILAAVCVVVTILLSDILFYILLGVSPIAAIYLTFTNMLSVNLNNLLSLFIKAYAIYLAYGKARVL